MNTFNQTKTGIKAGYPEPVAKAVGDLSKKHCVDLNTFTRLEKTGVDMIGVPVTGQTIIVIRKKPYFKVLCPRGSVQMVPRCENTEAA